MYGILAIDLPLCGEKKIKISLKCCGHFLSPDIDYIWLDVLKKNLSYLSLRFKSIVHPFFCVQFCNDRVSKFHYLLSYFYLDLFIFFIFYYSFAMAQGWVNNVFYYYSFLLPFCNDMRVSKCHLLHKIGRIWVHYSFITSHSESC